MTVNYYIDTTSSAILLVVQHKGRKFRVSTGNIIKPASNWDAKAQKIKSSFEDYDKINDELDSLKGKVKQIIRDYKIQHHSVPTLEYVKAQIDVDPNISPDKSFAACHAKFLEYKKNNTMGSTYDDYKTFQKVLEKFETANRIKINFDNINSETIEKLKKHLLDKECSQYTVKKRLNQLKMVLNWAIDNKYIASYDSKLLEFKAGKSEGDKIYLTDKELVAIEKLTDISKAVERAKDAFLLQCYTGLRFSDLKSLKKHNIKNGLIDFVTHKTKCRITIPVTKKAQAIFNKYKNQSQPECIPTVSTSFQNEHIKTICKLAKINEGIPVVRYIGNKRIDETFPKYELAGTHTGRRTFATLFILRGGQIETVSKLLGHCNILVTQRYLRHTSEDTVQSARKFM